MENSKYYREYKICKRKYLKLKRKKQIGGNGDDEVLKESIEYRRKQLLSQITEWEKSNMSKDVEDVETIKDMLHEDRGSEAIRDNLDTVTEMISKLSIEEKELEEDTRSDDEIFDHVIAMSLADNAGEEDERKDEPLLSPEERRQKEIDDRLDFEAEREKREDVELDLGNEVTTIYNSGTISMNGVERNSRCFHISIVQALNMLNLQADMGLNWTVENLIKQIRFPRNLIKRNELIDMGDLCSITQELEQLLIDNGVCVYVINRADGKISDIIGIQPMIDTTDHSTNFDEFHSRRNQVISLAASDFAHEAGCNHIIAILFTGTHYELIVSPIPSLKVPGFRKYLIIDHREGNSENFGHPRGLHLNTWEYVSGNKISQEEL